MAPGTARSGPTGAAYRGATTGQALRRERGRVSAVSGAVAVSSAGSSGVASGSVSSGSCGWLMRDATVAAVRKLKDTTGQYLWQPGLQAGSPDTILGKPVRTDPNVPAVALGAKSILFGDFSTYFVRQVESLRFERSDDFAFNTDLITYRAILRGDGDQVDTTGAIKHFIGNAA